MRRSLRQHVGWLLLVVVSLGAPASASFSGTEVIVPSVGRGPGSQSSQWYTTVWIHNPGSQVAAVQVYFLERGTANPSPRVKQLQVPPEVTYRITNAVESLFNLTNSFGALRLVASQKVYVNARIYSQAAGDTEAETVGQFFAATPASFAIGAGQSTEVLGVYQTNPQSASLYRYNFGLVETAGGTATVHVDAANQTGGHVGSKDYTLGPFGALQMSIKDLLPAVNSDNLRLHATVQPGSAGKVIVYGSGLANQSNDPSTFEMQYRNELLGGEGGGLTVVDHDATLQGDGTTAQPLGVADGVITAAKLSAAGSTAGQVLASDGAHVGWQSPASGGLTLPYAGSGSTTGWGVLFRLNHTSGSGMALAVSSPATAIHGSSAGEWGVVGTIGGGVPSNPGAAGVWGNAVTDIGVVGMSDSGKGVLGFNWSDSNAAVSGENWGNAGGIRGWSRDGDGVFGESATGSVFGVHGKNVNGTAVYGESTGGRGVYGRSSGDHGVFGDTSSSTHAGLLAENHGNSTWGCVACGVSGTPYGGYFGGNVAVTGSISKGGGSFRIDHPLDPENRYLSHSFVESPDMKNVYDGVVTTDENGLAVVLLPAWFEALNRDFRYQLTVIGRFAQAIVLREIEGNAFSIQTNLSNVKVSWQVTGIRRDPYAEKHRIAVEEDKPERERGTYLHPDAYGQPKEKGIERVRHPELMRPLKAEREVEPASPR